MWKKILSYLLPNKKIQIVPFVLNKDKKIKPYCIIIATKESKNNTKVLWSKLSYYDEKKDAWLWEYNNKSVDSDTPIGQVSIEKRIRNKVNLEYLYN